LQLNLLEGEKGPVSCGWGAALTSACSFSRQVLQRVLQIRQKGSANRNRANKMQKTQLPAGRSRVIGEELGVFIGSK